MPWFLKFLPGYGYPKGTCANSFIWTWRFFRNNVPCAWHSYLQSLLLPGKVKKGKKIILAKQGLSFWLQKGDKLEHTNKKHRSKKIQFQYVPCSGSHSQLPSGSQGASTTALQDVPSWLGFCLPPPKVWGTSLLQGTVNLRTFLWTISLPSLPSIWRKF